MQSASITASEQSKPPFPPADDDPHSYNFSDKHASKGSFAKQ